MSENKTSKENMLGRNIQHLRKTNDETLRELGDAVFLGGSTIANYEAGDRDPKPQILSAIAKHYGKTVDELINSDLTELPKHNFSINSMSEMMELWKIMFPLSSSERALQNEEFKKGYKKCCAIIDSFSKNDPVMGHIIPECSELFFNSMAENDLPEAAANIIWLGLRIPK